MRKEKKDRINLYLRDIIAYGVTSGEKQARTSNVYSAKHATMCRQSILSAKIMQGVIKSFGREFPRHAEKFNMLARNAMLAGRYKSKGQYIEYSTALQQAAELKQEIERTTHSVLDRIGYVARKLWGLYISLNSGIMRLWKH